ncbi:hypothetical protein EK599_21725 [Vibrio sp. T187]|uniref:hypothetical protein n=1 Tax=Vibrio TaxID=662 RepID=UPI0010C93AE3|nr:MULTISPECIES: hypothetical protein [Vibrio]MBW3698297.1 hypothetical protein [Vibrio sp. T187]
MILTGNHTIEKVTYLSIALSMTACGGEEVSESTPTHSEQVVENRGTSEQQMALIGDSLSATDAFNVEVQREIKVNLSFPQGNSVNHVSIFLSPPTDDIIYSQLISSSTLENAEEYRTQLVIPSHQKFLWVTLNKNYDNATVIKVADLNRVMYDF